MKLKDILTERNITRFKTKVELDVEVSVDSTKHSDQREDERNISDTDIRATVVKATEDILQAYLDGKIKNNEQFHIYDPGNNHLNMIAILLMNEKGTPEKIKVVTVIRKRDFKQRNISKTIKV